MRLVADTNVVISALLWHGTPYALFKAAQDHELEFFTSRPLLDELEEILARRKFVKVIRATGSTRAELFKDYQELAQIVTPAQTRRIVLADRDDDAVVACALAGNPGTVSTLAVLGAWDDALHALHALASEAWGQTPTEPATKRKRPPPPASRHVWPFELPAAFLLKALPCEATTGL